MKLQSTFQSQTCTKKKVMVTGWWSTPGLVRYSFLNPGETITSDKCAQQIDVMHQKRQLLQLALASRKGLVLFHDNTWPHIAQPVASKAKWISYKVLPHLPYSPGLSPIDYHYFKNLGSFLHGKCSISSRMQKKLSKSSQNPNTWIFMLQE